MSGATGLEAELVALGLTRDETRAYLALLERGRLTAREVCSTTGITRGRIYDVLGGLVSKGAAVEAISRPRSFEPAPPEAVVANLVESRKTELERIERGAVDLIDELNEQIEVARGTPTIVEAIHHKPTLVNKLDALVNEASEEILAFARPPFFAGVIATDYKTQFDAMDRGVRVRGLYESVLLERDDVVELITALTEAGEVARHVPDLPTKLFVVDRSVAVLPLAEPRTPEDATTLIIRHAGLGQLLANAFDYYWERASGVTLEPSGSEEAARA